MQNSLPRLPARNNDFTYGGLIVWSGVALAAYGAITVIDAIGSWIKRPVATVEQAERRKVRDELLARVAKGEGEPVRALYKDGVICFQRKNEEIPVCTP